MSIEIHVAHLFRHKCRRRMRLKRLLQPGVRAEYQITRRVACRRMVCRRHASPHRRAHDPIYRSRQLRIRRHPQGSVSGSLPAVRADVDRGACVHWRCGQTGGNRGRHSRCRRPFRAHGRDRRVSLRGRDEHRFSFGAEATVTRRLVGGARVDHQTGQGRDPAVLLYANGDLPFGPATFRQALRLQVEQRIQPANHATAFALSHIF